MNKNELDIALIAAIGQNNELGIDNHLIWKLPGDLKHFKEVTMGHPIVMGRKTFESMGSRKLPGRKNIILSTRNIDVDKDIEVLHSKEELIEYLKTLKQQIMIIGGAALYEMFINESQMLYLTEVEDTCKEADAYFPSFDRELYNEEILEEHITPDNIKYDYKVYTKK